MTVQELFEAAQKLNLADQLRLASQLMQAVVQNIQLTDTNNTVNQANDPIVDLFSGTPDLASQSKESLTQDINSTFGFSWKA